MTELKLKKLLAKRTKLLYNFFLRRRSFSIVFFLIVLVASAVATYFTIPYQLAHLILGGVTILAFLGFLLSLLRLFNQNIKIEELEQIIKIDREAAYSNVFRHLDIENVRSRYQADPLELVCPEAYPGRKTIAYRYVKKNKKVYYSQVGYNWLFFGEKSLYNYRVSVNHIHGFVGHECSTEFNYSDVVSIHTETTHKNNVEKLVLKLTLLNGEVFEILLRNLPNKNYGSTHKLNDKEAEIITTVRSVVRKSK